MSTNSGAQVQHHRRLVAARVDAHAQLVVGRRAAPPESRGCDGCIRNVSSPWASRSSRLATASSALLPPCPFKNTSLRAGSVASERPRSSNTDNMVCGDSQIVPGAHACSLDLV